MSNSGLITIGVFARECGLTPSALRFYADYGLLVPAMVDAASGYRYYAPGQRDRAVLIRRLRELDMPLERIGTVLDADDPALLVDEHIAGMAQRVREAQRIAADIGASAARNPSSRSVRMRGITFAAAVDQVLAATAVGPDFPALTGVLMEASAASMTVTATDRYRLSRRTLVPREARGDDWQVVLSADDLRLLVAWIRQQHEVTLVESTPPSTSPAVLSESAAKSDHAQIGTRASTIRIYGDDAETRVCRVLDERFPDYRMVFSALAEPRTRVVVSRHELLAAIEAQADYRVRLDITVDSIIVSSGTVLDARVTGPEVVIFFAAKTLHPAISTAIGSAVMLDISAADQPVMIRSADIGDLTTLAMPVSAQNCS